MSPSALDAPACGSGKRARRAKDRAPAAPSCGAGVPATRFASTGAGNSEPSSSREASGVPRTRCSAATILRSQHAYPKVASEMLSLVAITLTLDNYSHQKPVLHAQAAAMDAACAPQTPSRTIGGHACGQTNTGLQFD